MDAAFFQFYCLGEGDSKDTNAKRKSIRRERADSLPHSSLGAALRYFKGAFTHYTLGWECTWDNYMLFMASIERHDEKDNTLATIVKDAAEVF